MAQGLAHASNMENLCQEVQRFCSGTLYRFVSEPSWKAVQSDILIVIRRFNNVVRWKEFWRDQKQSTEPEGNEIEEEKSIFMATGLKPTFGVKTAKHESDNLEGFLTAFKIAQGLAHASNMENIRQEVQHVCSGTSDWFVPEPSWKAVQADILIAIRRFKNVVRWKEFWNDQKQSTEPKA